MTRRYEVHNQVTGLLESADTYADALLLRERIKQDYLKFNEGLFCISVLVKNEDGTWTQSLADENGDPVVVVIDKFPT
jgi:hypothetical protein